MGKEKLISIIAGKVWHNIHDLKKKFNKLRIMKISF